MESIEKHRQVQKSIKLNGKVLKSKNGKSQKIIENLRKHKKDD